METHDQYPGEQVSTEDLTINDSIGDDFPPCDHGFVPNVYTPPQGFKLCPENYIPVEPQMYALMLKALNRPQQAPLPQQPIHVNMPPPKEEVSKPVFLVRMLKSIHFGSFGAYAPVGQELEYCPEDKTVQIEGEKYPNIQSFISHWRMQYGDSTQRQMDVVRNPFFLILNPDTCPPLEESMGRTSRRPRYPTEDARIQSEDKRWDATRKHTMTEGRSGDGPGPHGAALPSAADLEYDPHARETVTRGQRAERVRQQSLERQPAYPPEHGLFFQPQNPQQAMTQAANRNFPTMPPRGGLRGQDGLTARARKIATMSGDQLERPVQRQVNQPIAGYEEPETIADFQVEEGFLAGGQIVSQIPGEPADEAFKIAQQLDMQAQQLQGGRSRYGM